MTASTGNRRDFRQGQAGYRRCRMRAKCAEARRCGTKCRVTQVNGMGAGVRMQMQMPVGAVLLLAAAACCCCCSALFFFFLVGSGCGRPKTEEGVSWTRAVGGRRERNGDRGVGSRQRRGLACGLACGLVGDASPEWKSTGRIQQSWEPGMEPGTRKGGMEREQRRSGRTKTPGRSTHHRFCFG